MSAWIVVCILVAIGVCTVHLFIGFLLGQRSADKEQVVGVLPPIEQVTAELRERLSEVISLTSQARTLSQDCSSAEPKLPAGIVLQAESIARGSASLQKSMESMTHVHSQRVENHKPSPTPSPQPTQAVHQQETSDGFDTTRIAKFRYEAWQHVAPMDGGELPFADAFEAVQCRDLSRAGFSFFTEDLPNAEMLVVAMGTPPDLRFFTARVAGSPTASRQGKVGYQIECQFVNKLTQTYQWDEEEERIVAASPMGDDAPRDASYAHTHAV